MVKAAVKKAKEKAQQKRVAEQAIAKDFTPKAAKVAEQPQAAPAKPYMICVDGQGVAYLRVEQMSKGAARYIINTGSKSVDLIEMDAATAKSRGLQEVPEASIMDAAKVLAKPLSSGIVVSERAKKFLEQILSDKEMIEMATKKAAEKNSKKRATTAAARTKGSANGNGAGRKSKFAGKIVVLNKEHGSREGSKRALLLDAILGSKTAEEALQKTVTFKGAKVPVSGIDFRFALDQKFIKLQA